MHHRRWSMPTWVRRMRWCFIPQSTILKRLPLYFFFMHFTHWYGKKKSQMEKTRVTKNIRFFQFFTISFTYLQKSVFDRSPRPMCNWVHSPGQRVQSALQSDHFCSFHRFLNIYFGKNSWHRKKHFVFLELRLEKMNNFFAFSKTSRSEQFNFSSRDVFGFLIFKFPMQNHNSKWAWVNEKKSKSAFFNNFF